MWHLILNFVKTSSIILYSSLKFLFLGSRLIQIIIFILNMLEDSLCAFKILREQLSLNPLGYHKERLILLADSQFGAFSCCSSDIMEAPRVALCAFNMSRNCSMRIQNMAGAALPYLII